MSKKLCEINENYTGITCPLQEDIINAACKLFRVEPKHLITDTSYQYAYIRWLCFYLIKEHTSLTPTYIAARFSRKRHAVIHGIESIESQRSVYPYVRTDLHNLQSLAGILYK